MDSCNPMPTPLPLQLDFVPNGDTLFFDPKYFRSLAGKLQYLTLTRPDIQFAVNLVCQRMHSPTTSDFAHLKRILRYLKGTVQFGLSIPRQSSLHLLAYNDIDWAGCKLTRRSTTGFCTFLGSSLIAWSAKKQGTVSRSSTEAEYRALVATAAEITWTSFILRDLLVPQIGPAVLHCDNLSAVYLSANPVLHNRSKHFDIDFHYIREQVAIGVIETKHVLATLQIADIFTKSLPHAAFLHLRAELGVQVSPHTNLRGDVGPSPGRSPIVTNVEKSSHSPSLANDKQNLQQKIDTLPLTTCKQPNIPILLANRFSLLS